MATTLQEKAMAIKLQKVKQHKAVKMGQVMVEAGFSPLTARNPKDLTDSAGWAELKKKYLDEEIALITLNELAGKENEDKDNRLKASTEILKLQDRYPAQKSKVLGLFGALEDLE